MLFKTERRAALGCALVALSTLGILSTSPPARGDLHEHIWQGDVDTSWDRSSNWTGGTPAEDVHDNAYFEGIYGNQPTLDASYTIGRLTFAWAGWTVSQSGSQTLTFDNTYNGGVAIYSAQNGLSGTNTFNATVAFNQAWQDIQTVAGNTLYLAGVTGSVGFDKTGPGTLVLTGNNSGYSGLTTIIAGTLQVGNGGTTGALGSGDVDNKSALVFNRSNTITVANNISNTGSVTQAGSGTVVLTGNNSYGVTVINSGKTLQVGSGGAAGTLGTGYIANDGLLVFNRTGSLSVAGNIYNSGSVSMIGTGTVTLNGTGYYSGQTSVTSGTLACGVNDALGSGALTVNGATAVLSLGGYSDTVGTVTLDGGGQITGSGTLTSTGSFEMKSGTVGAVLGGSGIALNKTTSGTVTLNNANSYSGATAVTAGTLAYGCNNAVASGAVTVNGATAALSLGGYSDTVGTVTLDGGGQITGSGTLTSTGSFEMKSGTVGAVLGGSGIALNKTTAGTVTLNNANTFSGETRIVAGTLTLGTGAALQSSTVNLDGGDTGTLDLNNSSAMFGGLKGSRNLAIPNAKTLTVGGNGASTEYSGQLSGDGARLTKLGGGTLTLTGDNSFDGGAKIEAGGLQLGNGGASGSIRTDVSNSGTLIFNRSDDVSFNYSIGGSGSLSKLGAGTLTLGGANNYAGSTFVGAGKLLVNGTNTGGGLYQVGHNATLGGSGSIGGNVLAMPTSYLAPGVSIGGLEVLGAVTIFGTLLVEADGDGAGSIDLLDVTGALDISMATVNFDVFSALDDPAYVFARYGSLMGEEFFKVTDLPDGYEINYHYGSGNEIALTQIVPEPAAVIVWLLLAGVGGAVAWRRKRKAA